MAKYEGFRPGYVGRVAHEVSVSHSDALVPEEVQFAFDAAMGQLFPQLPERISELRDALGGTNKAAHAIGVTPRTIQRYIAAEEHRSSQSRRADYAKRAKVIEALQQAAFPDLTGKRRAAIEREGVIVRALGSLRIGAYTEGRFVSVRIPGQAWKTILRHWDAGDRKGAARSFQQWFGKSYGRTGGRSKKKSKNYREDFTWAYLQELTFEPPN